jgi:predicted KAP-like P-loop ATPase
MWSDNETAHDFLNYGETAAIVADLLGNKRLRPISIGIFGGWGVGKSSLLKLVEKQFAGSDDYIVLNFDAWLFQDYDDARAALLDTIANALYNASESNQSLAAKALGLLKRVNKLRALGLAAEVGAAAAGFPMFGAISRSLGAVTNIIEGHSNKDELKTLKEAGLEVKKEATGLLREKEIHSPPDEIRAFRAEFAELMKDLGKTLIVFIDNLDRCLPRNAILTLEAVRLFLFLPQTAFVIAADEDMIRLAVSEHYKAGNSKRLVADYLDKLVQIPVQVPRPGVAEIRAFLLLLLLQSPEKVGGTLSDQAFEAIRVSLEGHLRASWKEQPPTLQALIDAAAATGAISAAVRDELAAAYALAERMAPLLAASKRVNGNPRIVKRMLNTIRIRDKVAKRRAMPIDQAVISKLVLFERCAGEAATAELFRLINASETGKPSEIDRLEQGLGVADIDTLPVAWREEGEFINEWATLEPKLGQVDLRPAAYLARETMPLRLVAEGLTPDTQNAVRGLMAVTKASSPAGLKISAAIATDQREAAVQAFIRELSKATDWQSPPPGFYGAVLVIDQAPETGKAFALFLRRHLAKIPAWMTAALKKKPWWEDQ